MVINVQNNQDDIVPHIVDGSEGSDKNQCDKVETKVFMKQNKKGMDSALIVIDSDNNSHTQVKVLQLAQ